MMSEIYNRCGNPVAAVGSLNDALYGSGSADILWGGKGNDYMSGGAGGDYYIFQRGDGQDVIDDQGTFSFGPVKAGIDFLSFRGDITASDLKLYRDGASDNLRIVLLDKQGNETSDSIEIVGQFGGVRTGLGLFSELLGSSDGLDYVAPNLIERFIFEDGTSLDFTQIVEQVQAVCNGTAMALQAGQSRRAAAANDDGSDAWPERPFRWLGAAA
jgi:hypothetical protein